MDKIICVGKNYLEHAKELGDSIPEMPVLFLKPPSAHVQATGKGETLRVKLPSGRGEIHHECEIVGRLGEKGRIDAVTLGLDMTLREVQASLKKGGHPWEVSKVFEGSALLGPWIPVGQFEGYLDTEFSFSVGGKTRQKGLGREMRVSPERCIAYAAGFFPILPGDLLFTGTPAGVGPVRPGDLGELRWGSELTFRVQW